MSVKQSKRQLTIVGAYGGANIGDEMILRSVVRQARQAGYCRQINVICQSLPGKEELAREYEQMGVRVISWRRPFRAITAVFGRALFIGGGQIIDGGAGPQNAILHATLACVVRLTGGTVDIGGVGVYHLRNWLSLALYRLVFVLARSIGTRDQHSADDIVRICRSAAAKVSVSSDVVFALADEFRPKVPIEGRSIVAIAIHQVPYFQLVEFEQAMRFLRRLHDRIGEKFSIVLLVHDARDGFDIELARKLAAGMRPAAIEIIQFNSAHECVSYYREVRSVISVRMHPLIIGAIAGAHCVALKGSRKVSDIAEQLGICEWDLDDLIALDDEEFDLSVGLDATGMQPDPAKVEGLRRKAIGVVPELANADELLGTP